MLPNIGEIASLYPSSGAQSSTLNVNVGVVNPTKVNFTDFTPGQKIDVVATVNNPGGLGGHRRAPSQPASRPSEATSAGVPSPTARLKRAGPGPSRSGTSRGSRTSMSRAVAPPGSGGDGFAPTFVGYLANFVQPLAPYPWTFLTGLETAISISDLFGKIPAFLSTPVSFQSYSILDNNYKPVGSALLNYSDVSGYYVGTIQANFPTGVMALVTQGGVAGYLPFVSGISLLGIGHLPSGRRRTRLGRSWAVSDDSSDPDRPRERLPHAILCDGHHPRRHHR